MITVKFVALTPVGSTRQGWAVTVTAENMEKAEQSARQILSDKCEQDLTKTELYSRIIHN